MSKPSVREVIHAVADYYDTAVREITSARRNADVVLPRHVAMFVATRITGKSLPEIGRAFGGRDHTTVLHARQKMEALISNDDDTATEVTAIEAGLLASHRLPDWIKVTRYPDLDAASIVSKILDSAEEIDAITIDELITLASIARVALDAPNAEPDRERPTPPLPPASDEVKLAAASLLAALDAADDASFANRGDVLAARKQLHTARIGLATLLNHQTPKPQTEEAMQ